MFFSENRGGSIAAPCCEICYIYCMATEYDEACTIFRNQVETFCKMTDTDWELLQPHLELKMIRKHQYFTREGKKEL